MVINWYYIDYGNNKIYAYYTIFLIFVKNDRIRFDEIWFVIIDIKGKASRTENDCNLRKIMGYYPSDYEKACLLGLWAAFLRVNPT